jgi:hypothetical protein
VTNQLTPGAESSAAGRFAFIAFPARVYVDSTVWPAISVSRETKQTAEGTPAVSTGPQNPGSKLSESLINNPSGVNNPVPFDGRKETASSHSHQQRRPFKIV